MKKITWTLNVAGYKEHFRLPEPCRSITIGRDQTDIPLYSKEAVRLSCFLTDNGVRIRGDGNTVFRINNDPGCTQEKEFTENSALIIGAGSEPECFRLDLSFTENEQSVYDRHIDLTEGLFSFGSREDNTVTLPSIGRARTAFLLKYENGHVFVTAKDFPLGCYINETRLNPDQTAELKANDFIFTAGAGFVYNGDNELITTADIRVNDLNYRDRTDSISHLVYPQMIRTSRYHYKIPSESIEILDPPRLQEENKQNIFVSLIPAASMLLLVLLMRGSGGLSTMFLSVGMMSVGAVTSVYTILHSRKEYRGKKEKRLKDYTAYLQEQEESIQKNRVREQEILSRIYISSTQELRNVREFSPDLFDRTLTDQDFLHVRFGYGRLLSGRQIKPQEHKELGNDDEMIKEPERLKEKYRYNEKMPAIIEGTKVNAVGILGDLTSLRRVMNTVTLDLTTRHTPDDVQLYLLCDRDFENQLRAYRFFPHVWNRYSGSRNIACDADSRNAMLEELYKALADRESCESRDSLPWMVIYIHSDSEVLRHPLIKFVEKASALHALFIFWSQQREEQPLGCRAAVRLFSNETSGVIVDTYGEKPDQPFICEDVSDEQMENAALRLSPVYVSETSLAGGLTSSYTLYETLGIRSPEPEVVLKNWRTRSTQKSLAVPIGITSNDMPQILDLHERAHGPHGLVAGTTGSGKSEVIISYLMSLAWAFSPEDVNIVIIDFKGGGMGNQLEGLPHLTGVITNLSAGELERSLASIKAELIVRQQMLADAKVANISDYTREYKGGRLSVPMPHLLLVVDEFAELKAQQPDFMDELISAARIGRSLGIHLILSTQKPYGVVNEQILSNMDFRMCLRVQSRDDSNEMLQSPLAAEIKEPGRAYLKVSRCEMFQLFQSGYSGGSIHTTGEKSISFRISKLSLSGRRELLYQSEAEPSETPESDTAAVITQFSMVKAAIQTAWEKAGLREPRKICQPPLPGETSWKPVVTANPYLLPVGLVDLPDQQKQDPLLLDLNGENVLIAGGSQMGKTTMLQTIIRAASENMDGQEIAFYILDFNSGVFRTMEHMAVIGGVVTMDEEERVKNLFRLLLEEISVRKEKLLEHSVLSFASYRESGETELPAIALLIDNFAVFRELYDDKYGGELLRILRDGPSMGISMIVTATDTAVIGYRRLCYFNNRFVFHCNDISEYSSVLEGIRNKTLGEIPGRVLLKLNREAVEAQISLPFTGETDQERAQNGRDYIAVHTEGARARQIPAIPALLTANALSDMFGASCNGNSPAWAMSYRDVAPIYLNLAEDFELALVGTPKAGNGNKTMLHFLMQCFTGSETTANIRIADNYEQELRRYQSLPNVAYATDASKAPDYIREITAIAEERFLLVSRNGPEALQDLPAEIVILCGMECLEQISDNEQALEDFERINSRYRRMKIFFLFAGLEDKAVSYNSPKLLRHIQEKRHAVVFDNVSQIKMFDLSLQETRENRDRLGRDDAFLLTEDDMQRIHLASPEI